MTNPDLIEAARKYRDIKRREATGLEQLCPEAGILDEAILNAVEERKAVDELIAIPQERGFHSRDNCGNVYGICDWCKALAKCQSLRCGEVRL